MQGGGCCDGGNGKGVDTQSELETSLAGWTGWGDEQYWLWGQPRPRPRQRPVGLELDSPLRLGYTRRHQPRGCSRGGVTGPAWQPGLPEYLGAMSQAGAEEFEGKADITGMCLMGGSLVSAAGLLSCSYAGSG